jgi:hypothetical protein
MAHLELGRDIFIKIKKELNECSKIERDAKMEGRRMTLVLQPDSKTGKPVPAPAAAAPRPVLRPPGTMAAGSSLGIKAPPQPVAAG